MGRYQKSKTNLDFTEARDIEWQWHQLGHMQVCTSLQTDNHASTPPLSFLQAGCPSCRPTNSVKALNALYKFTLHYITLHYLNLHAMWDHIVPPGKGDKRDIPTKKGSRPFSICIRKNNFIVTFYVKDTNL